MSEFRTEADSLGRVEVPAEKLWGAQTQRSLQHFSIGQDLIPREMIAAYAVIKRAAATANHKGGRLPDQAYVLIARVCDEILGGKHQDMFPLHVWMTGSGTQFNMNVNEVVSNRCCQLTGTELGSKHPVHPNDHVNMSQSSNDSFPSAMHIAAAVNVKERLMPAVAALRDAIAAKAAEWDDIVKIGRTHMQDATPLTLGQEWSGYAAMLADNLERVEQALPGIYRLALGGTAVGTGINSAPGFGEAAAGEIARLTNLPFVSAPNKFAVQGAHDALVQLSGTLRTLAISLCKIGNDIRLLSCGPRAGFAELLIPENEPGSSIVPGKVNPTQAEALTMIAVQIMANDIAVGSGGAGGYLEMNVYKPVMIANIAQSITLLSDVAGLILRGVAFEFRSKAERMRWIWNASFAGGSVVAAFVQGSMVGALAEGLPLSNGRYAGGEFWLVQSLRGALRDRPVCRLRAARRLLARAEMRRGGPRPSLSPHPLSVGSATGVSDRRVHLRAGPRLRGHGALARPTLLVCFPDRRRLGRNHACR
jgi:fumarate hydratase class II